jgi:hypothetical protein
MREIPATFLNVNLRHPPAFPKLPRAATSVDGSAGSAAATLLGVSCGCEPSPCGLG